MQIALAGAVPEPPPMPLDQDTIVACLQYIQLVLKNPAGLPNNVYVITDGVDAFRARTGSRTSAPTPKPTPTSTPTPTPTPTPKPTPTPPTSRSPRNRLVTRTNGISTRRTGGRRLSQLEEPMESPMMLLDPSIPMDSVLLMAEPEVEQTCDIIPPPITVPENFEAPPDGPLVIDDISNLISNDIMPTACDSPLQVTSIRQDPDVGATVVWSPGRPLSVTPAPGFNGTIRLVYTVKDCNNKEAIGEAFIRVTADGPGPGGSCADGSSPKPQPVTIYLPLTSSTTIGSCPGQDVLEDVSGAMRTAVESTTGSSSLSVTSQSCTWIVSASRCFACVFCCCCGQKEINRHQSLMPLQCPSPPPQTSNASLAITNSPAHSLSSGPTQHKQITIHNRALRGSSCAPTSRSTPATRRRCSPTSTRR